MLIKFFPNGKGGGAGPVSYLTARTVLAYDENRNLIRDASGQPEHVTRDPLPEVLRGDAAIMTDLIDAWPMLQRGLWLWYSRRTVGHPPMPRL
jgi:hypothetical protein